ncbi:MAG: ribose-5-phosphate isomerase A, partial [Thermoplasmata archaeon]
EKTPVPIEVVPYGWKKTKQILETKFGCRAELRRKCGEIYSTDSENYILDCKFERIEEPEAIEREIKSMTGVIESGLFCGIATLVIVGDENGKIREIETSRTT